MGISWASILEGSRLHLHLRAGASVAGFIADFYCHKAELVIELDGGIHGAQKEDDAKRDKALKELGLRVVRIKNEDIMKRLPQVVAKVQELISN